MAVGAAGNRLIFLLLLWMNGFASSQSVLRLQHAMKQSNLGKNLISPALFHALLSLSLTFLLAETLMLI